LATLAASPAFATPVDAVTAEAALLLAITSALIVKHEFAHFNTATPVVAKTR
jgi:hypothetical protein